MHTGVALRRADGTRAWRTWELVGVGGIRLNKFEDRLRALHETERFVRVSYEGVYHGPNNIAVGVLRHFEAIILNWTARVGLPCWAYSASEIKRAVATGRADKRQMIERVRWLGFNVANNHEADAVLDAAEAEGWSTRQLRAEVSRCVIEPPCPTRVPQYGTPLRMRIVHVVPQWDDIGR